MPVAGQLINQFLAAVAAPVGAVPAPVVHALTYATVELYRQKDSPPATADDFGLSPGYVPADPLQTGPRPAGPVPGQVRCPMTITFTDVFGGGPPGTVARVGPGAP